MSHGMRGRFGSCAAVIVTLSLAGCATQRAVSHPPAYAPTPTTANSAIPQGRPQAVEPNAGVQAASVAPEATTTPVGDPNAHAPPLSEVQSELRMEVVATRVSDASYIDPLQYVSVWERTDQGVDAVMPVGAPILAPCSVKILAVIPDWYQGQPLVYWELLDGADAGKIQYVAEEITAIARPGTTLQQGQPIARFAASGTGIEFGWSTINGVTLAMATTGYEEGQATPAGQAIRAWLNSLGAHAGNG